MLATNIWDIINKDCQEFIKSIRLCKKNVFILRGHFYQIQGIQKFQHDVKYRRPRNMPQNIHDEINIYFEDKFGWKIRNGVFCYGFNLAEHNPIDLGYGIFHLFFPIGNFKFVFSDEHFDLFGSINNSIEPIETVIKNLKFDDKDFCRALTLQPKFDNFSNEISFNTSSYYLINTIYYQEISRFIWPD